MAKLLDLVRQLNELLPPFAARTVIVAVMGGGRSISEFVMKTRAFGPEPGPATSDRAGSTAPLAETEMLPFRHSQPLMDPSGAAVGDVAGTAPFRGTEAVISCSAKSVS